MIPLPHRVIAEAVVLLIVGALLTLYWAPVQLPLDGNLIWVGLAGAAAALGGFILYQRYRAQLQLSADIALTQSAALTIIKELENYPNHAAGRRARNRKKVLEDLALKAAEAGRPLPMGDAGTLDLSTVGLELIERNEKDSSGHWRRVNGVRRGCQVFVALFQLKNPTAAFLALTEHVRVQARLEPGQTPSLTELKMLFGFPLEHPEEGLAERLEREGLSVNRELELLALANEVSAVFKGLFYTPFPVNEEDQPTTYWDTQILDQFRAYMR
jgi:hypothetical protein